MVNPFRAANLQWLAVQIGLFVVFWLLGGLVPVHQMTRLIAAVALSAFFKWVVIAIWANRRHA